MPHGFTDAEILALHRKAVTLSHRLAGELGLDQDDAESAANVAFMEFLAKFDAAKGEPGAFLHTVIRRAVWKEANREMRHGELADDLAAVSDRVMKKVTGKTPRVRKSAKDEADAMADEILAMKDAYTAREISQQTGVPYRHVRRILGK